MGATVEAGHAMVLGERVVRPADKVFRVIRRFEMVVSVKRTVRPTLLRRDRGSRNFFVKLVHECGTHDLFGFILQEICFKL